MLPGVALLAILLIGLASSLYTLATRHGELPAQDVSWSAIANGDAANAVNHVLQKANPLEDSLVTFDRVVAWVTVGDLGARVRRGCGNWLFLTDELTLHPDRAANAVRRVVMVERVAAFLKSRRIALAVVPVPDKSRVESADLCGVDRPSAIDGRLGDFTARLREKTQK
jgi:alginate O-acetyltransferase complex protein AlgJ